MLAAVASFGWAQLPGPREACCTLAMAALAERALIDADNGLLNIPPAAVLAYAEHPDAVVHLEAALEEAHRRGSLFAAAGNRMWLSYFRYLRSELGEAVALATLAIEELVTWGFDNGPDYGAAFLIMALLEQGELSAARAVLDGSREPSTKAEGTRHWHEARLLLLAAERRDAEALAHADRIEREFAHVRNPTATTWRLVRAELRMRAGDEAGARADVAEHLALARSWGSPGAIGRGLRVAGELFGEDLEEAIAVLERSSMRIELAKALLALGRRHRLARRPTDAREPLRRALEVSVTCGATALTEEIRAELAAAGARPRSDVLSGPAALTPSERRVATLAAGGMTNRDIAERLFVTPKTIEVHLSATYRKLNIGSRRELAGALA
jgi:DNA-binding NarL/FixJ family response regulator